MKFRSTLVALLASLMLFGAPVSALAQDNTAVAINTKDGTDIFRFAFNVTRVANDVVDQGNAAVAYASCESCTTVALAIQIVLVMSDPSVVTPTNLAIAINDQCTLCETFAGAYQFVLGTSGPVHFTADGNQALADLRNSLRDLLQSEPTIEDLVAALEPLMSNLDTILTEELVPAGQPTSEATPSETASPTPTPEESAVESTPSPAPSSEATSEPSTEASPTPSEETSASPEPSP